MKAEAAPKVGLLCSCIGDGKVAGRWCVAMVVVDGERDAAPNMSLCLVHGGISHGLAVTSYLGHGDGEMVDGET